MYIVQGENWKLLDEYPLLSGAGMFVELQNKIRVHQSYR